MWRTALYTPFYPNGNLCSFLKDHSKTLTTQNVRTMSHDVLQMLEQLRSMEIVHRDLKPANIVVSSRMRLCLVDFGSAVQFKHRMANTGRVMTTAIVRAPEVLCRSTSYSYEVDVWAAGIVL